tara:strand:+ start:3954 stop:4307 length:354 start_codon:yes stop_codon:yes gene_type:complete
MSNSNPEQFEIKSNRRQCCRVPLYHNNQKIYLEIQLDPETGELRVVKPWPEMKEGTELYSTIVEAGFDITAQLDSYPDPLQALSVLRERTLRRGDGTPITVRGAIIDRLFEDPYLEK